jgi:hypothetical protein
MRVSKHTRAAHAAGRYHPAERSALLPALDLGLLCQFLDRRSATEAMRDFRDALRAGR